MRHKQWQACVDFALECMSNLLEDSTAQHNATTNSRDTSSGSRNDQSLSMRLSQRSGRSIGKEKATLAEEIVATLKSLSSASNAPLMTRAGVIAENLQEYLNVATTGQEDAFETVNNIIFVSLTEDVALTQNLLCGLIPIMRRLWSSRSAVLREQMLITLFSCRYLFIAPAGPWPPIEATMLEPLFNNLMSEYRTRNERDMLHFDDMQPLPDRGNTPLKLKQFQPLRNSAQAVNCWLTVEVMAYLVVGLSRKSQPSSVKGDPGETPRKRQKIHSQLDEILELASAGVGQEKLAALQIILFLFDQPVSLAQEWTKSLKKLLPDLNSEDSTIQTWVFLVYSRCATTSIFWFTYSWPC